MEIFSLVIDEDSPVYNAFAKRAKPADCPNTVMREIRSLCKILDEEGFYLALCSQTFFIANILSN